MMLDLSVGKQAYVEDCEVCCNPIEISYTVADEELAEFSARTWGDSRMGCRPRAHPPSQPMAVI